jgi:hypothetical protein
MSANIILKTSNHLYDKFLQTARENCQIAVMPLVRSPASGYSKISLAHLLNLSCRSKPGSL